MDSFLNALKKGYSTVKKKVKDLEDPQDFTRVYPGSKNEPVSAEGDERRRRIKESLEAKRRQDLKAEKSQFGSVK